MVNCARRLCPKNTVLNTVSRAKVASKGSVFMSEKKLGKCREDPNGTSIGETPPRRVYESGQRGISRSASIETSISVKRSTELPRITRSEAFETEKAPPPSDQYASEIPEKDGPEDSVWVKLLTIR